MKDTRIRPIFEDGAPVEHYDWGNHPYIRDFEDEIVSRVHYGDISVQVDYLPSHRLAVIQLGLPDYLPEDALPADYMLRIVLDRVTAAAAIRQAIDALDFLVTYVNQNSPIPAYREGETRPRQPDTNLEELDHVA